jgi:hypothetical protein
VHKDKLAARGYLAASHFRLLIDRCRAVWGNRSFKSRMGTGTADYKPTNEIR